jgi:UDP-N-acetylmuramyl tripeptide synthase
VLNADDSGLVEFADTIDQPIIWFSLDPDNPQVSKARARGETACWMENDWLLAARDGTERQVVPVIEMPSALGGVARYNIRNALAAMGVTLALGIDNAPIRQGLTGFRSDELDNPGRGNWFERRMDGGQVRILVDFAHNEHGMNALAESVRQVPSERTILLIGQAGDRSNRDIIDLLRAALSVNPDQLLVAELPGYERGRKPYEVPELIRQEAIKMGIASAVIEIFPGPREATASALSRAKPGDLLVLLALTQRSEALTLIHEYLGDGGDGHG